MNARYLQKTVGVPNMPGVTVANPGPNVSLKPNYFHFNPNTQKYRMGDDIISLQQSRVWHESHYIEGKVLGSSCTTQVGLTQAEYGKVLAHVSGTPTRVEVDLLENSQVGPQHPLEVFIPIASQIEIAGNQYAMKIDFGSGNFHMSNIPIGTIGERFTIELL